MADLRQVVFRKTGHFHDGITVNVVLQHGTSNLKGSFTLSFFNAALFTELNSLLDALLFKLLYDGHKCVSVLRHTLSQFAY